MDIGLEEKPAAIQLFGSDPEIMGAMAKKIEGINADTVDINMGCPVPKGGKKRRGQRSYENAGTGRKDNKGDG